MTYIKNIRKHLKMIDGDFKCDKKVCYIVPIIIIILAFVILANGTVFADEGVSVDNEIHAIFDSYSYIYNSDTDSMETFLSVLDSQGNVYTFYWDIDINDLKDYARSDYYFYIDSDGQIEWVNVILDGKLLEDY